MSDDLPRGLAPDPALDAWLARQRAKRTQAWRQAPALLDGFREVIAALDQTLADRPEQSWEAPLWKVQAGDPWMTPSDGRAFDRTVEEMQVFSAFWYVAYHAIFFLDIDFTLLDGKPYKMPEPFGGEDEHGVDERQVAVLPRRVYTKAELRKYLDFAARRVERVLRSITEEGAEQRCPEGSSRTGRKFGEVLQANLEHLREHGGQLSSA